ncbi:hypothetical protein HA72_1679 [Metallosphaera sedula]|uniref:Uncharacterized protein n=3 Tax=Metallosphaera TaxID=41980 RepID=A4YHD2_METS5|nr:hypothetical protein Msed_1679 [Metallosphaera sedula DSM 5348]AIM27818.1 hypothetical protein HA72_1679 [Metallosphaera sedula]QCO30748.1 hypothetical protein DFR88_09850 [Metallosphaera prunae]AKV74668.1 hypothetical protein MsedA_1713 [Metallosphaera sedula]AKV76905.1 hypothetical protein MsedB_1715 [Metallosphaera sedula]
MIENFYVNHFKVSFITDEDKRLVFLDLSIPCNRRIKELEYLDTSIETKYGTVRKVVICPVNGVAFICNAVVELNSSSPSAEEIHREVESELMRVGCTP